MSSEALTLLYGWITQVWRLFSSLCFPGTNVTFAQLGFFTLFVAFNLKYLQKLFQEGPSQKVSGSHDKEAGSDG